MSKKIEYEIDDLTYLTIEEIFKLKNVFEPDKIEINSLIGFLIEKALKGYIFENESLLSENLQNNLSVLDRKIEGEETDLKTLFTIDELIKESKAKVKVREGS